MSWGQQGWGQDPFGGQGVGGLSISRAFAVNTRATRVFLTEEPLARSRYAPGDALNPDTWAITRVDTSAPFKAVQVDRVSPTSFDVRLLFDMAPSPVAHRIASSTLKDGAGNLLSAPYSADYDGVGTRDVLPSPRGLRDIKLSGGTFATKGGDYDQVEGPDLIKRLIFQRITTVVGSFFHLPGYGLGLRVNEPVVTADLVKLKKEVERQVLEEPEVLGSQASITVDPRGVVSIVVRARTVNFGSLEVAFSSTDVLVVL